MRPLVVLEVKDHLEFDSVIVWDEGERRIAFAYKEGRVQRTSPMTGDTLEADVEEAQFGFQIRPHQLVHVANLASAMDYVPAPTRVTVPTATPAQTVPTSTMGERWGLDR